MCFENHFKRWRIDSLLYLDQSTLEIVNVVRRGGRQKARRVLLLRAFEGFAVVTSNHSV